LSIIKFYIVRLSILLTLTLLSICLPNCVTYFRRDKSRSRSVSKGRDRDSRSRSKSVERNGERSPGKEDIGDD